MNKEILSVNNLQIDFKAQSGWQSALKGISFQLYENEIVGLVGESGSGKTLTALSVIQLLPNANAKISGQIHLTINDQQVELISSDESVKSTIRGNIVSMIFQEPMTSLNPVMRCGKQVLEAFLNHSKGSLEQGKKEVLGLFEKVGLPSPERIYRAYPHELSGGQLQRVMITMALICKPRILICDEPTTALDVTVQSKIMDLIKELQKELGLSVLFITHDLNLVGQIADRVIVMKDGNIVEENSCKNIFSNPEHNYTKALLASRPPLDNKLKRLPTVDSFLSGNSSDLVLDFYKPEEIIERLEMLQQQQPILEVTGIEKHFVSKKAMLKKNRTILKAVNNVSFSLYPGETLGLVGESGCGKSTLGKTVLKLLTANAGEMVFSGSAIDSLSDSEFRPLRKDIQIIFQDPYASLNPRQRVLEILTEPMLVHGIGKNASGRKEIATKLLLRVGLNEEHLNRYPHQFSGGQRQRICIARALALKPKLIICDESVSALDVSVQAQVLNLLIELREEFGMSYLFISHDLSVVKFISDRMMVMQGGSIVEIGAAEEIYNDPQTAYTKELIDAVPKAIVN
ncbi:MAG: ABC transporter ATP-binding protein [Bacteroidia bacterium]|nr:ABC transporter ATP-binding protein [Bacteroidia bacterium]NNM15328.1 ABC transporter ATP-binding protein [Bacteroidia bacterium]